MRMLLLEDDNELLAHSEEELRRMMTASKFGLNINTGKPFSFVHSSLGGGAASARAPEICIKEDAADHGLIPDAFLSDLIKAFNWVLNGSRLQKMETYDNAGDINEKSFPFGAPCDLPYLAPIPAGVLHGFFFDRLPERTSSHFPFYAFGWGILNSHDAETSQADLDVVNNQWSGLFPSTAQAALASTLSSLELEVCCVSDTRVYDSSTVINLSSPLDSCRSKRFCFRVSGEAEAESHGRAAVGIALSSPAEQCLLDWIPVNGRFCAVRLKRRCVFIIPAYTPTDSCPDATNDAFYDALVDLLRQSKHSDIIILAGDFNAQLGRLSSDEKRLGGARSLRDNHRGISLVSFAYKLLTILSLRRITEPRESEIREEQAGFRSGRGFVDQIFTLRRILEHRYSYRQPTVVVFLDLRAAFDSVARNVLWSCLLRKRVPEKYVNLLRSLFANPASWVRVYGQLPRAFIPFNCVRQGCPISPYLFTFFMDDIVEEALRESSGLGVELLPGVRLTDLKYADGIDLLSPSAEDMRTMLNKVIRLRLDGFTCNIADEISARIAKAQVAFAKPRRP
ncbi:uncharacterized protein DEA37_0010944 [Paragonimus westermani]|uniref:Reverse transcriptase domain-containing protein n=1 Tax=Paragonimus westermani TaxID=34504 RepID=A0A5J4NAP1_9TREM|nr:uncharacterized protein DEA37_0010944 [Paragonimus westermani]